MLYEQYDKLRDEVQALEADVKKFDEGNSAAGTRVRTSLQSIKVKAQDLRNAVTEIKNGRKG